MTSVIHKRVALARTGENPYVICRLKSGWVVTCKYRSLGIGAKLLYYAENLAIEKNCEGLRLCTGVENESGKRFYEREGWVARAMEYKKKINLTAKKEE